MPPGNEKLKDLPPLHWDTYFEAHNYMDSTTWGITKKNFSDPQTAILRKRSDVLKNSEYDYGGEEEIQAVFYGAMLKQMLQSNDPKFVMQKGIVGILFDWNTNGNTLVFNPIAIDARGYPVPNIPIPLKNGLYALLKSDPSIGITLTLSSEAILRALGFEGAVAQLPVCQVAAITIHPLIVPNTGKSYFALGSLQTGISAHYSVYIPPCPPFCYPPR